jgi:putative transcriptional regulator
VSSLLDSKQTCAMVTRRPGLSVKTTVVNRLRELRQEHNLTQAQLAADLEVTRHTILALEVGRYVPSIELALRLAAYFGLPLERVFWLDPPETRRAWERDPKPGAQGRRDEVTPDG